MKLTDEQKEQMKMAERANGRLGQTWALYELFLTQDKPPRQALELAQEAVSVWAEFQDNNTIEPPEIEEQPDFPEQLLGAMTKAADMMKGGAPIPFFLPQAPVDAEFVPPAAPANPSTDPVHE